MAYADLLDNEGIVSQYLVVLKPRAVVPSGSWTLVSGTEYTQTFSLGEIVTLTADATTETKATSSALSDGNWYHDTADNTLYFDNGVDPSTLTVVATYEIYLGTFDAHFYRDPLDNTTREVYYEPLITASPRITQTASDDLFGFLPTVSTSISISNMTQFMQLHVYASSFHNAAIDIYHYLDELTVANTKLIASGFCGNVRYLEKTCTIEVYDNRAIFDEEFRHGSGMEFYASGTLSGLDPDMDGRPVRKVYGVVDKFIPVNIDFNATAASTTNNRDWICINPHDNLGSITATVSSSPASTTTRTYVDDVDGIRVGDTVWIDKATDEYVEVTVVNKTGDHYIEHAALVSGAAAGSDTVKRNFIGSVTVVREGFAPIKLKYKDDYDEYTDGTNKLAGFTLNDNFESSYNAAGEPFNSSSGSSNLETTDLVYCRVYGNTNQETLGGPAFGSDSENTGNLARAIVVIYSLLKNNVGLAEAEIDTATFTSLESTIEDEVGFAAPERNGEDFPKYRDILTALFQTLLLKFYINDSGLYSIVQTGPLLAVDKTIKDDEILLDTFEYNFDYKDIVSDVIVEYEPAEVNSRNQAGLMSYSKIRSSSNLADWFHKVNKQKTFKSLHFITSEAQTLADRLSYALSERRGRLFFKTKNRFFDSEINEVIRVTRTRSPGFTYDADTERNRDGVIISADKGLKEIEIEIDDQKGIEDNSGSW